jgi:MHS family proline/betaine transporter-like MFS transporter
MTVTMVSLIPVFGSISDKLGRPLMMRLSAILVSVLIFPYLWSLEYFSFIGILASGMCVTCVVAMFMGCMNTYILEIFPVNVRYSCFGFFYSIGMGIFGGTAPMIGTYFLTLTSSLVILGIYLIFGCMLGLLGVAASRRQVAVNTSLA